MQFEQAIRTFLEAQLPQGSWTTAPAFLASPFPVYYVASQQLAVHAIALQHPALAHIAPHFFAGMSDAAAQHNIRLIHLWEDVWCRQQALVRQRLCSLLGQSKRIHGRETVIVKLDQQRAANFLDLHHLQQSTTAYYKYGLQHKGELVAVATFSKSRVMKDGAALYRSYELVRFASKAGVNVNGGLSKLLHHFIAQQQPAHLMTYADRDWGAGSGYAKLGFHFAGHTEPQEFLVKPQEMQRIYPHRLPEGTTAAQLLEHGYVRVWNAGNTKFILDRRS